MKRFLYPLLFCSISITAQTQVIVLDNLKFDDIRMNAQKTAREISHQIYTGDISPSLINQLEQALTASDYQYSQYATKLLTNYYEENNIPPGEWHDAVFDNLIKALHDDNINSRNAFSNSSQSLNILYDLESHRPSEKLKPLLDGDDSQARFAAAILLSNYLNGSVQPKVSRVLFDHMQDDDIFKNEFAALRAFMILGEENYKAFHKTLNDSSSMDWQQAACITYLSAYYDLPFTPVEQHISYWQNNSGMTTYWQWPKINLAALYLTAHQQDIPIEKKVIQRMNNLSQNLDTLPEKAQWLQTWFWFLRMDDPERPWYNPPYCAAWALTTFNLEMY